MTPPLTVITTLLAGAATTIAAWGVWGLRGTSLRPAAAWALAATAGVTLLWTIDAHAGLVPARWTGIAWYALAVLLVCPPIAVLGARRPGVAAWNWFVLLPLIAVLGWPALAALGLARARQDFSVEAPVVAGFALVLLMGCGNYLGTRFWLAGLLSASAALLLILPLAAGSHWPVDARTSHMAAIWCLAAAAGAVVRGRHHSTATSGPDRVWHDFRHQFGLVWAQRVQEQINQRAVREGWPVRLHRQGFVPAPGAACSTADLSSAPIEQSLRWHLRRFVDESWLDERFGHTNVDHR